MTEQALAAGAAAVIPSTVLAILIILGIVFFGFWLWMLIDMLKTKKLSPVMKLILFILFFGFSLITSVGWLIVRKKVKKGRK